MGAKMRETTITYKDVKFDSEDEARWAVLFDLLGTEWHYKHQSDVIDDVTFIPSFWLPHIYLRDDSSAGILMNVRSADFDDEEDPQLEAMATKLGVASILAAGFQIDEHDNLLEGVNQITPYWDNFMMLYRCQCGAVKFEFTEGNYLKCPHGWCGRRSDDIAEMYLAALNFDFGRQYAG